MYKEQIKQLLSGVKENQITLEEALKKLEHLPYEDLGFAKVDHHRALRRGFPEVVYCQEKTSEQVAEIFFRLADINDVLATRATEQMFKAVKETVKEAEYNSISKTIIFRNKEITNRPVKTNKILVISAGTSDIPVAEEAAVTAEISGNSVGRLFDVGVAGIHRLFDNKDQISEAGVLVVVAGMDGVLPSVVSGLVDKPVIAVPTSVGYGASFQGIGPLLTMLNACAPGIVVVNIDNGFGAGYFASLINE